MTPSLKGAFLIAAVLQIVWGAVPSASQFVIQQIPVELYITLRWSISCFILFLYLALTRKLNFLFNRNVFKVFGLGVLGYGIGSFGTLFGLKSVGVLNFALISALGPLITSLLSVVMLHEKTKKYYFWSLAFCIIGLLLVAEGRNQNSSQSFKWFAVLLILGAVFLEALVFIFSKKLKAQFSTLQYMAIAQLSASVFMWSLELGYLKQFDKVLFLDRIGWLSLIFVSVVACVFCYAILYWLLEHVEGHKLAIFDSLHTISASALGVLLFSEIITGTTILGGLLILSGIYLIQRE